MIMLGYICGTEIVEMDNQLVHIETHAIIGSPALSLPGRPEPEAREPRDIESKQNSVQRGMIPKDILLSV